MPNLTQDTHSPTTSPQPSDEILARKAAVEQEAFTILYRRYIGPVYRYLYARHGNRQDAEDLAAQVFVSALEGLPRYREEGSFAAWLFAIARHKSAEYFRRWRPLANVESEPLLVDHSPGPQALVEAGQELQSLRENIASLDANEQELLRLRFAAGLSFDQIANLLGRNPPAVKMALYRLLDRLGQSMGRAHAG